jgi:maltooligosyltrehalose trehalohydrolase
MHGSNSTAAPPVATRRLGFGAEPFEAGVRFRVWAPKCRRVQVEFVDSSTEPLDLSPEQDGYFAALASGTVPGALYSLRLDGSDIGLPDPASRFQPHGPRGPSQVVDPRAFRWHDDRWPGLSRRRQVLYELHVGTFTPQGTWCAAQEQLGRLADVGITALQIMPVAEFPGRFGWSYDLANLFAPSHLYGEPDDFRAFVDAAHQAGVGVILDVIYNHVGWVGEGLLRPFSDAYFSTRHKNEWGAPLNFDDAGAHGVRAWVLDNVRYWIDEFHLDGYRLDATQAICDESPRNIMLEIARAARAAAGERNVLILGESEPQTTALLRSGAEDGCELDALVNDDFHHAALVRLTGRREAYFTDYTGNAEEFLAAARWGYLFQGQRYAWQRKARGTPAFDIEAPRLINYLESHDQLANSLDGVRVCQRTSPARYRAMTALLLLGPQTPMLFQGQEYGATIPFLYFNDSDAPQADAVRRGRAEFLAQFPSLAHAETQASLPDPCHEATFLKCKLPVAEQVSENPTYRLHRDLLQLRRDDPVLSVHDARQLHGATLGTHAFLLRYLTPGGGTRLVVFNFDCALRLASIANPLVAAPCNMRWQILWSSEDARYGGHGTPELDRADGWHIPGECAVVLHPVSASGVV